MSNPVHTILSLWEVEVEEGNCASTPDIKSQSNAYRTKVSK